MLRVATSPFSLECKVHLTRQPGPIHFFQQLPAPSLYHASPLKLLSHAHTLCSRLSHTTIYTSDKQLLTTASATCIQLLLVYRVLNSGLRLRLALTGDHISRTVHSMSGSVEMERPQEIASKVLRRAQVSKVSLSWSYTSHMSCTDLHEDGTHTTGPPGTGECQGEAWLAESQPRSH